MNRLKKKESSTLFCRSGQIFFSSSIFFSLERTLWREKNLHTSRLEPWTSRVWDYRLTHSATAASYKDSRWYSHMYIIYCLSRLFTSPPSLIRPAGRLFKQLRVAVAYAAMKKKQNKTNEDKARKSVSFYQTCNDWTRAIWCKLCPRFSRISKKCVETVQKKNKK